jgi:hypothetical protein
MASSTFKHPCFYPIREAVRASHARHLLTVSIASPKGNNLWATHPTMIDHALLTVVVVLMALAWCDMRLALRA